MDPGLVDARPVIASRSERPRLADRALQRVTFARPKSRILACPRLVTKMFAGLMSRWTMPSHEQRLAHLRSQSPDQAIHLRSIGLPAMRCFKVMPSRNSMTMNDCPSYFPISWIVQILGWFRAEAARLRGENVPMLAGLALHRRAETSGRRSDQARCPQLCRPHPSRRRPASRRCGSARSFDRQVRTMSPLAGIIGLVTPQGQ